MHRAHTAFSLALSPMAHKNFATWLLNSSSSQKVSYIYIVYIHIVYMHYSANQLSVYSP